MGSALEQYQRALDQLQELQSQHDASQLEEDIMNAIQLLQEDIASKVRELERMHQLQQQYQKTSALNGNNSTILAMRTPSSSTILRNLDASGSSNNNNLNMDPLLGCITTKLQNSLVSSLLSKFGDTYDSGELESLMTQHVTQLKRDIAIFEQRKFKDYEVRLEQLIKENKKLSNQIVKLKTRWDSLVESAKQKRNLQNE